MILRLIIIFICLIGTIMSACNTSRSSFNENDQKTLLVSPTIKLDQATMIAPTPLAPSPTVTRVKKQSSPAPITILQKEPPLFTDVIRNNPTPLPMTPQGGNLNIASPTWFSSLDPHREPSPSFAGWGPGLAYSRILKFRTGENVKLPSQATECDLCEKWYMRSPDTFVFQIKKNVDWQPSKETIGKKVTAYDVAFSLNRQKQDFSVNAHIIHMIKNIEAESSQDLKIVLNHPDADMFVALANGKTKILPKDIFSNPQNSNDNITIGSGPWKSDYKPQDTMVQLTKWNYKTETPYIHSLEIMHIPDHQARKSAYLVNLIDIYQIDLVDLKEFSDFNILEHPDPGVGLAMAFNTITPPFNDIDFRKAVMLSINPDEIIEEGWNSKAFFSLGYPMVSPAELANNENIRTYFNMPDIARNIILNKADQGDFNITITTSDFGQEYMKSLEIITTQMRHVGFNTTFEMLDRRQYSLKSWKNRDYQMLVGPILPQSSLNGYLLSTLHSNGPWNTTHNVDTELDQLIKAQLVEYDYDARQHILQKMDLHLLEKGYRFMPATRKSLWSWAENVSDFYPNFSTNEYSHWEKIWVKP